MELEPSGGGANARSTHWAKGPGRAQAAPASPEGAWAAADDTAAAFAKSRAFQPRRAVAATIALSGDRYCIQHDPLRASVDPPGAPIPAIRPAAWPSEYTFQPGWGLSCGPARGSAFSVPSARGHEPTGRGLPGPFPCSGGRPAAAARTCPATGAGATFFFRLVGGTPSSYVSIENHDFFNCRLNAMLWAPFAIAMATAATGQA